MNRRGFFQLIASVVAVRPIARVVQKIGIGRSSQLVRPEDFTRIALDSWSINSRIAYQLYNVDDKFEIWPRPKIGETINIRRPARFVAYSGEDFKCSMLS